MRFDLWIAEAAKPAPPALFVHAPGIGIEDDSGESLVDFFARMLF